MLLSAILIFLIPLTLFSVLALFHKRIPRHGDWLATGGMGVALLLSLVIMVRGLAAEDHGLFVHWTFNWLPVSSTKAITGGILIDGLTAIMLVVVTLVSFLVHLFSSKYMEGDVRYGRYYASLLLFTTSMLGLVLADNLLYLFVFWELVGLSSYVLIGHWYEKKSASNAAIKAFITTRVGDIGMLLGMLICYWKVGSLQYVDVFAAVGELNLFAVGTESFLGVDWQTLAGIGLFLGAMGKSAQFPFHVWLPDAMEGPTPVSALIHAATMVAAGVYLVGRLFPIFTPEAFIFIAYTGAVTALFAASIATVQDDIKKVLAYSTLSQLGYMVLALGVGGFFSGLFHLTTHAFFKAGLFLGSGSVIYAMHHEQRMSKYGGLWKKMPITGWTYLICVLAIAGFPGLAGFFSKDAILADTLAFAMLNPGHGFLVFSGFFTALLTAFYMFRQFYLTFTGKPRDEEKYSHAHESPRPMTIPLIVLAFLAVTAGWFNDTFKGLLPHSDRGAIISQYVGYQAGHGMEISPIAAMTSAAAHTSGMEHGAGAAESAHAETGHAEAHGEGHGDGHHDVHHRAHNIAMTLSITLALLGIAWATGFYYEGQSGKPMFSPAKGAAALGPFHGVLWNKYYFDEIYDVIFVRATHVLSRVMALFDKWVIDGIVNATGFVGKWGARFTGLGLDNWGVDGIVNGVALAAGALGDRLSYAMTGKVRQYLLFIAIGVIALSATLMVAAYIP